jgi:hypothetical protein
MRALIGDRNLSVVYVNQRTAGILQFAITGDAGFLAVFATFDASGRRDSHVGRNSLRPLRRAGARRAGVPAGFPVEMKMSSRGAQPPPRRRPFTQGTRVRSAMPRI